MEAEPRGVDIHENKRLEIAMSSTAPATSGGSTVFGFIIWAIVIALVVALASSVFGQPPAATTTTPVVSHPVVPAPAPTTTGSTFFQWLAGLTAPSTPTVTTPPVYIPLPSYKDAGYSQNDEVPSQGGTIKIRRTSGAFRAEGPESIANALLVKEKIATQGREDFNSALARPIVSAPPQVVVQTVQMPVLVAPAPPWTGYIVLGPTRVRDCNGRTWHFSRNYWHY